MNMKKGYLGVVSMLLVLLMLFASCGKSAVPENDDPTTQESVTQDGKEPTVKPDPTVKPEPGPGPDIPTPDIPTPDDDPILDADMDGIPEFEKQGAGYGDILRLKSTGQIVFSPYLEEFMDLTYIGEKVEDYQVELWFILLDDNGNECYAYPKLTLPIYESPNGWFDVFLQAADVDCGFCPTTSRVYTIELTLLKEDKAVMEGTWQKIEASDKLVDSDYYRPSDLPTDDDLQNVDCTVEYRIAGVGGTLLGPSIQNLKAGEIAQTVTAVEEEGYMFSGWSDGYPGNERTTDKFIRDKVIYAKFTKIELDPGIANMYIQTETGLPVVKKNYVNASIRITGAANDKYNISFTTQIRGRGNSSFSSSAPQDDYNSKNSYRLKLTEKENLLGVGGSSNKDWVLNSNKFDASNLRNYFVWNLANQMQTFPFVPGCTWVNLYINGDYRGIYMLTDHIEVAGDRVEVDDSGDEPDKGYLIELDFRGNSENDAVEGLTYFYVPGFYDDKSGISNPREWVIKSEVTNTAQTEFIRDYVIQCHNAIMSGDRAEIDKLVDIPSLIDIFIIEELSKDVDAGGASIFMQKDKGGKLYFTAPWDFDFGFGTYGPAVNIYGFVCESASGSDPNIWFKALIAQPWFMEELSARLRQIYPMIENAKNDIVLTGELLEPAADRNDARWDIYGEYYHSYVSSQVSGRLYSYDEHIDFLCNWIDDRFEWMLEELALRM